MRTETVLRRRIRELEARVVELSQSRLPMSVEDLCPSPAEIEDARREGFEFGFHAGLEGYPAFFRPGASMKDLIAGAYAKWRAPTQKAGLRGDAAQAR